MGVSPDLPGSMASFLNSQNSGPKYLLMSRVSESEDITNLSRVSPFLIKKVIDTYNGEIELCKKLRDGRVLIKTKTSLQAHKLLQLNSLTPDIKVCVTEHSTLNFVKGIIYSNDLRDISEEIILENLRSQNVVQVKKILKKDGDSLKEIGLIIITFEALSLPLHLSVGYERVNLRPYIPLPMRCNSCFVYGHTAKYCKTIKMCANCGETYHLNPDNNDCCEKPKTCINCKAASNPNCLHSATDKSCPIFLREKEIQAIMTLEKVNKKTAVSLYKQRYPASNTRFANVVRNKDPINVTTPITTSLGVRPIINYSDVSPATTSYQTKNANKNITKTKKTTILPLKTSVRTRRQLKKLAKRKTSTDSSKLSETDNTNELEMEIDFSDKLI